jgi:hypothetical protein
MTFTSKQMPALNDRTKKTMRPAVCPKPKKGGKK